MSYDRRIQCNLAMVAVELDQFQIRLLDEFAAMMGLDRAAAIAHLVDASYGYMTMALNLRRNLEARSKLER